MKTKILTLIFSLLSLAVYAQHDYDNQNTIYSHGDNKISIGTSTLQGNYGVDQTVLQLRDIKGGWLSIGELGNSLNRFNLGATKFGNGLYFDQNSSFNFYAGGNLFTINGIDKNGFVGIGTKEPNAKLTINGGDLQVSNMGHFKGWTSSGLTGLGLDIGISHNMGNILTYDRTNKRYHTLRITARSGINNGLFVHENGNVGIDNYTPSNKLSVNGTIRSKEIICEASPWPDYVFEDSYQLLKISQIENFISQNGHLPNIPSAEEVKENGIALGEMNAKLLEKIEELTLYIIQQEKRIKTLETIVK